MINRSYLLGSTLLTMVRFIRETPCRPYYYFHIAQSKRYLCIFCPWRRDHSLAIPRPDQASQIMHICTREADLCTQTQVLLWYRPLPLSLASHHAHPSNPTLSSNKASAPLVLFFFINRSYFFLVVAFRRLSFSLVHKACAAPHPSHKVVCLFSSS